ncbi:MAG: glycosyltransferase family 2 protein, partial [Dolichospermum sp.]
MNDNLITVVIPAYNRAKVIESAIDSVLKQSYQNFEIIIVNDGSSDNTGEVVAKL